MAAYAVERLARAIDGLEGKTVLILGLSYRPDIKEPAFSSAFLLREGADRPRRPRPRPRPLLHRRRDPRPRPRTRRPRPDSDADAIIVQAWHTAYRDLDLAAFRDCRAILDGRNALSRDKVESLGILYLGIGR